MSTPIDSTRRALTERRSRILHRVLVATAILAGVAYVPGVWAAYQEELWAVIAADTLTYGIIVSLALARRLSYPLRAGAFVAVVYFLALVLLVQLGALGGGIVWLAVCPVLAAVFFRIRAALAVLALTGVTLAALGVMIYLDPSLVGQHLPESRYTPTSWLANAGTVLFLAAILSLSIAALVRWLEGTLEDSARTNLALQREAAERKRLQDQLLQSQKMEALGTLAGGIAHDFNNLLVPILANTREVQERLPEESAERQELNEVARSAERARELVQQVLAFSRASSRKRSAIQLDPLVEEVAALLRRTASSSIELVCRTEASDSRIHGNSGELHQVVMNLATNGLRAMESGPGTLILTTAENKENDTVTLQVSDTGSGMAPEVVERAFDPFFTTREPGEGTGLGLATVHGIVTSMGGQVELESEVGAGTTVRVHLPRLAGTQPVAEPPHSTSESPEVGNASRQGTVPSEAPFHPRVLVVDDDPSVRRVVRRLLERNGHRVVEVADASTALATLARHSGSVDLVITDYAMPRMSGIELAKEVLRTFPDLPVVLASGFLDPSLVDRAREAGVFATLDKPFEQAELLELVRQALGPPPR